MKIAINSIGRKRGQAQELPGFVTPAVGLDQPFEMLSACHERVQRTLRLLEKIVAHVQTHGPDEKATDAAVDVLRYFDLAAPRHHEDEELHVFPLLLQQNDATLTNAVTRMQTDHAQMNAQWARLREPLVALSQASGNSATFSALTLLQEAAKFIALYADHIHTEDTLLYPAAIALADPALLARMSADMRGRRTVSP
ncbi:MAG: hemerythrin domain-containing protein [Casimicrobium sp.]